MDDNRFQVPVTCQQHDPAPVEWLRADDRGALDTLLGGCTRRVSQRGRRLAVHNTFMPVVAHSPRKCGQPVREWLFAVPTRLAGRARMRQRGVR